MPQTVTTIPTDKARAATLRHAKGIQHKALSGMAISAQRAVDRQVERGTQEMTRIVDKMTADASAVLESASRCGPLLMRALEEHSTRKLTLGNLEIATRIYERMLTCSRKVLRLDEASQGDSGVRVAIFLDTMRPSAANGPSVAVPDGTGAAPAALDVECETLA